MKKAWVGICFLSLMYVLAPNARGVTTIDAENPYAYGANIGWFNLYGDGDHGAVIGHSYCTGYVWSANCGWISLGNGPTNGWRYSNASADDWGVNLEEDGRMSGYAYGANIGWINFEQTQGCPRVSLRDGSMSGYAYGANVGWIGLSNQQMAVKTESLSAGPDTDADGIPDTWEYKMAGNLTTLSGSGHDADDDGVSDVGEYKTDTNPLDAQQYLVIAEVEARSDDAVDVRWQAQADRYYYIEYKDSMKDSPDWSDSGYGMILPSQSAFVSRMVETTNGVSRFYRLRTAIPLAP